jgi:hypothetical protein
VCVQEGAALSGAVTRHDSCALHRHIQQLAACLQQRWAVGPGRPTVQNSPLHRQDQGAAEAEMVDKGRCRQLPCLYAPCGKLDADGGLGLQAKLVAREAAQQVGLANARVTDEHHLEQIVIAVGIAAEQQRCSAHACAGRSLAHRRSLATRQQMNACHSLIIWLVAHRDRRSGRREAGTPANAVTATVKGACTASTTSGAAKMDSICLLCEFCVTRMWTAQGSGRGGGHCTSAAPT